MSVQMHDDDVIDRLRAGAPGYPEAGPDAGRTLAAAQHALRRSRVRRALGGVAAVAVVATVGVLGLTAVAPIQLPGIGPFAMPGANSLPNEGDPPVYPRQKLIEDAAELEADVLPVVEDLGLTGYGNDPGGWGRHGCRGLTWSHGAFSDRDPDCSNPDDPELPFDAESEAAFGQVSSAIEASGVDIYRIEKGGWGPGTSFHLNDSSIQWNWYYSYDPTTAGAPDEIRTETPLGTRLQVHVTGHWWFTVEPDD